MESCGEDVTMPHRYTVFTTTCLPTLSLSAIAPLRPFIACGATVYDVPLSSVSDPRKLCANGIDVEVECIRYAKRNKLAKLIGRDHTTHVRFLLEGGERITYITMNMHIYDSHALVQVSESSPHGITGVIW